MITSKLRGKTLKLKDKTSSSRRLLIKGLNK